MSIVYVLHLSPRYLHAQHYIGFSERDDVGERLAEHLSGGSKASPLIKAAVANGSDVRVAHVFAGATRTFERSLKNRADVGRWCPVCARHSRPLPRFNPNHERRA